MSVFEARLKISRHPENIQEYLNNTSDFLYQDVNAVFNLRKLSLPVNFETFKFCFDNYTEMEFAWLNLDRDFIYCEAGIHLLKERYLKVINYKGCTSFIEPIQYMVLRTANTLTKGYPELTEIAYDLLSCGFLVQSSVLADDNCHGNACKLYQSEGDYGLNLIKQLAQIKIDLNVGTGIGLGFHTIRLKSKESPNTLSNSFRDILEDLNSYHNLCMQKRLPKTAIYIPIHNNTIFEVLSMKNQRTGFKHVFGAVILNSYFMECVENEKEWYLFSGDEIEELHNAKTRDEYESIYKTLVSEQKYEAQVSASKLFDDIAKSLETSSGVYIIHDDALNKYNNNYHLGKIKTLNLCSEITNFTTVSDPSVCTLISANIAMFSEFPEIVLKCKKYIAKVFGIQVHDFCDSFKELKLKIALEYTFIVGFMGCILLNSRIGGRKNREIATSPMGMHDAAIILNLNPVYVCEMLSEALYKGSIVASCKFYEIYGIKCNLFDGSQFSIGKPQWKLRDVKINSEWDNVCKMMKKGMSNTALTAQAPTATTSQLVSVTESVQLLLDPVYVRNFASKSTRCASYGFTTKFLKEKKYEFLKSMAYIPKSENCNQQLEMYKKSAPFIDHSQSTYFNIELNRPTIKKLIIDTFNAKLKTGIYYIKGFERNKSLTMCSKTCTSCD